MAPEASAYLFWIGVVKTRSLFDVDGSGRKKIEEIKKIYSLSQKNCGECFFDVLFCLSNVSVTTVLKVT